MPTTKRQSINLLPQSGLSTTTTGRVMLWLLSTFRIIVIVTEIFVMTAFISRFYFDSKNSDLTNEIEQKVALLTASKKFEDEFRLTQSKLALFSKYNLFKSSANFLDSTRISLPVNIFLKSLSYNNGTINISGFSPSEQSIQQLLVNLSSLKEVDRATLLSAVSDQENPNLINFDIQISSKESML